MVLGPPRINDGAHSGEELCNRMMHKLANYERLHVDMRGCRGGVSASFLKHAFGGLVDGRHAATEIFDRVIVSSSDSTDIVIIAEYIEPMLRAEKALPRPIGQYPNFTSNW